MAKLQIAVQTGREEDKTKSSLDICHDILILLTSKLSFSTCSRVETCGKTSRLAGFIVCKTSTIFQRK